MSALTPHEVERIVAQHPGLIARLHRASMQDKTYQLTPIGAEVAAYMRHKRKRLTAASQRGYESFLDKLARDFADFDKLTQFEPPDGTTLIEEFLDRR